MDWKLRFKNPTFWISVILSIVTPIGAYFGVTGADMTSWAIVLETAFQAISNPWVCVMCVVSLYNSIVDPRTTGITDKVG